MSNAQLMKDKCCDRCWHADDRPCPDVITCLQEGPCCHENRDCSAKIRERMRRLRREVVETPVVTVGMGGCGLAAGAGKTYAAVLEYSQARAVCLRAVPVGCAGLCSLEPLLDVQLPGRARLSFHSATADRVAALLPAVIGGDVPRAELLGQTPIAGSELWPDVPLLSDHPFFKSQTRIVLERCGLIDPCSVDEYIAYGGFRALAETLKRRTPAEVCALVEAGGLRGRGPDGLPAGRQWQTVLSRPGDEKYLICNADERDPGRGMSRALIESDPYRVIEGMTIAAYAVGARKAWLFIPAAYSLAAERFDQAIAAARGCRLLGENILDSGYSLEITMRRSPGAFVCGEDTGMLSCLEGRRAMPRPRSLIPEVTGLFGRPTVINSVETLAHVPALVERGPEWFGSLGTADSKGTKVLALSGHLLRTGVIEVAMGTALREIVYGIGGGIRGGKRCKAVQLGGPGGACVPEAQLDAAVAYESLEERGVRMASAGLLVLDEDTCMVELARYYMEYMQRESCGKCIPCREGSRRMRELLAGKAPGRGENRVGDLKLLAEVMRRASRCRVGQRAADPVVSTLRFFPEEYEAHLAEGRCPVSVCRFPAGGHQEEQDQW